MQRFGILLTILLTPVLTGCNTLERPTPESTGTMGEDPSPTVEAMTTPDPEEVVEEENGNLPDGIPPPPTPPPLTPENIAGFDELPPEIQADLMRAIESGDFPPQPPSAPASPLVIE